MIDAVLFMFYLTAIVCMGALCVGLIVACIDMIKSGKR